MTNDDKRGNPAITIAAYRTVVYGVDFQV